MGKVTGGGHCHPSSLVAPEQWAHQELVPSTANSLTSADTSTTAHIPAHRLSPAPPRPFVLIPDSAAPAAAAKRTLHFRFRTEPPLSQNLRPFLPVAPPLPPPLPRRRVLPARGVLGTRGGRGLAALQPRQAQSPPDKPLNRGLPRGVTPAFGAKTSV